MSTQSNGQQDDFPEIIRDVYARGPEPGTCIYNLADATRTTPEEVALSSAAILGGIAGHRWSILGPANNAISGRINLLAAGLESPAWSRLQSILLEPVRGVQRLYIDVARAASSDSPESLRRLQNAPFSESKTQRLAAARESDIDNFANKSRDVLRELRSTWILQRPRFLLESPDPGAFTGSANELFDDHLLITDPRGRLFDELARTTPNQRWLGLMKNINASLDGADFAGEELRKEKTGNSIQKVKSSLLMTCCKEHLMQAIGSTNEDVQELLQRCLLLEPRASTGQLYSNRSGRAWAFQNYRDAVENLLFERSQGSECCFAPEDHDYELLTRYDEFLQSEIGIATEYSRLDRVLDLPWKIAWALHQLQAPGENASSCVPFAIHVAHDALIRHGKIIRSYKAELEAFETNRLMSQMLQKIARMGPSTLRDILRTCRNQRKSIHLPVLELLVESGKVLHQGNLYALADGNVRPNAEAQTTSSGG